MRSYEISRELSYESFIETYGRIPVTSQALVDGEDARMSTKVNSLKINRVSTLLKNRNQRGRPENVGLSAVDSADTNNNAIQQEESNNYTNLENTKETKMSGPACRKLRKITLRKKESRATQSEKSSSSLNRSQSVSHLAKSSTKRGNWLSNFSPSSFHRTTQKRSPTPESEAVPMSKMNIAAYRGYLSKKDAKKQTWERFWCILQDSCLYCYASPNSEFADDVLSFGGYFIITKAGNANSLPTILLERPEKKSYEFRGDNQSEHDAWVMTLRKNIDSGRRRSTKITRSASTANCLSTRKNSSLPIKKSSSELEMDVTAIKAKLLREVLEQQQEILREQKMLEKMSLSKQKPSSPVAFQKGKKALSITSLAQSEDNGYCSSLDVSLHDNYCESDESKQEIPSVRTCRSMSTVSVTSNTSSLGSIKEEGRKNTVNPKVLAEIEEFRVFSQKTKERRSSNEL